MTVTMQQLAKWIGEPINVKEKGKSLEEPGKDIVTGTLVNSEIAGKPVVEHQDGVERKVWHIEFDLENTDSIETPRNIGIIELHVTPGHYRKYEPEDVVYSTPYDPADQ